MNKFNTNQKPVLSTIQEYKFVQIGIVVSVDDSEDLGRIKIRINGPSNRGGDDGVEDNNLPWAYPMMPKFFNSNPKVGEAVFVLTFIEQKAHSDRLYFGPIISQPYNLNFDSGNSTALTPFSFRSITPKIDHNKIPALKGVFPKNTDISIQGRNNTDITFDNNEIQIRVNKFITVPPNENNSFNFQFNTDSVGYINIRGQVPLSKPKNDEKSQLGSVVSIVGNKINLLTHKDGSPRFDLANQDNQISNEEILNILQTAHPIGFGDLQLEYLILLKNAFLSHVHNNNGRPPTDLTTDGNKQAVDEFRKKAADLENKMLSKNIRIN